VLSAMFHSGGGGRRGSMRVSVADGCTVPTGMTCRGALAVTATIFSGTEAFARLVKAACLALATYRSVLLC
jgi:hypothetical protein